MNSNTANTENFAWVDAVLQHHALQEQRDYEEQAQAMEVEETNPEWAEENGSESEEDEDLGAAFLDRPPPLTRNNACFLTMSIDELTGDVVIVEAEDQDDQDDAYEPVPMEICGDSDDDILDEDEPLYPLRLFPEGDDFEVDADGDMIIERLPSGNTLVISHRAREGKQEFQFIGRLAGLAAPVFRSQQTSWIDEDDDLPPPLIDDDSSDDEDLRVIT